MTYAGLYGHNDGISVDRVLRREGHPLGVRRAVATKVATEEPETASNHKRWALGAAAGALLVAGTFAAGALGLSGGATPTAGSAPEHAPASPGHSSGDSGPVVGAPAPDQQDQQQPQGQPGQQPRGTQPTSSDPQGGTAPVVQDVNTGTVAPGGENRRNTPGTSTPTPTTPPSSTTPAPDPTPAPPASDEEADQGGGGLLDTVGDTVGGVLTPVTDTVGGILSPSSSDAGTTAKKSAPAGPALTMINPLGDLLAS